MKTLLTTLLIVLSTSANATVVAGIGTSSDGSFKSRGWETNQDCHEVLAELEIRKNPGFSIWYGQSYWGKHTSWIAQYPWNGGNWTWTCHGEG